MSLYGIESDGESTKVIGELVEMASIAEEALQAGSMNAKGAVEALKLRVTELFKKNKHRYGPSMSAIEAECFGQPFRMLTSTFQRFRLRSHGQRA